MSEGLTPKERKAEYDREYRKRNKERIAEYKRAWLRKNSLRVSEQRHEYYMKHKKERQIKNISEEIREYDEWLERKYANRKDKDSILPVGITDAEFRYWAIRILLGASWHVEMPAWKTHINEKALEEIIFQKCGLEKKDRKGKGK